MKYRITLVNLLPYQLTTKLSRLGCNVLYKTSLSYG